MPAIPAIAKGILSSASLTDLIGKMPIPDTNTPANITDKDRWFTMTINNQTQWPIQYMKSYFDSGRFFTAPTNVEPFKDMQFSGCDKDGSIWTGVTGGSYFRIRITTTDGGYEPFDFCIGWGNPRVGACKTALTPNTDPESAYNALSEGTSELNSNVFTGQDDQEQPVNVKFEIKAESGQHMICTITETLVVP